MFINLTTKQFLELEAAITLTCLVLFLLKQTTTTASTKRGSAADICHKINKKKIGEEEEEEERFQIFTNPICPFAQRCWIVITELNATKQFRFIPIPLKGEILRAKFLHELPPWASSLGISDELGLNNLKQWYIENINTGGDVPTLIDHFASKPTHVFKESDIIAEYIALILGNDGNQQTLFPTCNNNFFPEDVVRFRFALKTFPVNQFYTCLRNQLPNKDLELFRALFLELSKFTSHMSNLGPFYLGKQFSFADIYGITFVLRFKLLFLHYRSVDLFQPSTVLSEFFPNLTRFKLWFHACSERPSIQKTTPKPGIILSAYELVANDDKLNEKGFFGRGNN